MQHHLLDQIVQLGRGKALFRYEREEVGAGCKQVPVCGLVPPCPHMYTLAAVAAVEILQYLP